jgi:uncharacterized protein (DUF2147 family)
VKRTILLAMLLAAALGGSRVVAADDAPARVLGRWLTEPRNGIIEISVTPGGAYEGRIVGGNQPGRRDEHNPDPARRRTLLRGQVILRDMRYAGAGKWVGGSIYDPDSGRTYRCHLQLLDGDRLRVRGYLGVALIGRSQVWTRYLGASLDLSPN